MMQGWEEFLRALSADPVDPAGLRQLLDGLDHSTRVKATRALGPREQRRLYEAAEGSEGLRLVDLVPAESDEMSEVRHFGRNTLPAFRHFEKRFFRPVGEQAAAPALLYGYNHSAVRGLVGPGYFAARACSEAGEVRIDYGEGPTAAPEGWPRIQRNELGLSRFVYGFMVDRLRRVSEHVSIGSAARRGRDLGSWFVLCREA